MWDMDVFRDKINLMLPAVRSYTLTVGQYITYFK